MDVVQRRGSAARIAYKRRFLSFILCSVLVLGLMEPPKVEAAPIIAGAVAVTAGVGAGPVLIAAGVLGALVLAAVGMDFNIPYFSGTEIISDTAYNVGLFVADYFMSNGNITQMKWWEETVAFIVASGGVALGQKFLIPGDIAEDARQWALSNYFSSANELSVNQRGLLIEHCLGPVSTNLTQIILPISAFVSDGFTPEGVIYPNALDLDAGYHYYNLLGSDMRFSVKLKRATSPNDWYQSEWFLSNYRFGMLTASTVAGVMLGFVFGYDEESQLYRYGLYYPNTGAIEWDTGVLPSGSVISSSDTLIKSGVMDEALDRDKGIGIIIPPGLGLTGIGGLTVPVIKELDYSKVRDNTLNPDKPAIDTGTMVGDITLNDIKAQEQSLGAIFISKFPFSIPWDVARSLQLLAAPAIKPRWEIDLLEPIEYHFGQFPGDTTIVIDLAEYAILGQFTRWCSTLLFCWGLMLGTKRLVWTE